MPPCELHVTCSRTCVAVATPAGSAYISRCCSTVKPALVWKGTSQASTSSFTTQRVHGRRTTSANGPLLALPSERVNVMSCLKMTSSASKARGAPSETSSQPGALSLQHTAPPVEDQYDSRSPSSAYSGSAV